MNNLSHLRKEVRDLITVNEKIQSALVHGDQMTEDEATLIRQCAKELLEKTPASPAAKPSDQPVGPVSAG